MEASSVNYARMDHMLAIQLIGQDRVGGQDPDPFMSVSAAAASPEEKDVESFERLVVKAQRSSKYGNTTREQRKLYKKERVEKSAGNRNLIQGTSKQNWSLISGKAILDIRYSQDSINDHTSDGLTLDELVESMKKSWKNFITVVEMPDSKLVSLDNRRLYVAKKVVLNFDDEFEIKIQKVHHQDKAPKSLLSGISKEYKKNIQLGDIDLLAAGILKEINQQSECILDIDQLPEDILEDMDQLSTGSYGHCAFLRIHMHQKILNPKKFGYDENPVIRHDEDEDRSIARQDENPIARQ